MTLVQAAKTHLANRLYGFMAGNAQWDWLTTTDRNRAPVELKSSDASLDFGTREEMLSEARSLTQVFGISRRIMSQFSNYTIGTCECDWETGDDSWDDMTGDFWRDHMQRIDARGRMTFPSMMKLAVRSALRDGDLGFGKTKRSGIPQLIAFEGDRIRTASHRSGADFFDGWVGGVRSNGFGMATSYRVWERTRHGQFQNPTEWAAKDFIHYSGVRQRFDSVREPTHFTAGTLNHMRDMLEIVRAEKKGVKVASKIALYVQKLTGAANPSTLLARDTKPDGSGVTRHTEEIDDGVIRYMFPGETVTSPMSGRPSAAWQGFIQFLIADIAVSFDIPFSFVWTMLGLNGPAVRMEAKQAERTFDEWSDETEAQLINPTVSWVITDAMENGLLPFNPFWMKFTVARPAHPSIDVGRESEKDLKEHKRGWTSSRLIVSARGGNSRRAMKQKAKDYKEALEIAESEGVPVEVITDILDDSPASTPDGPEGSVDEDDDEEIRDEKNRLVRR